MKTNNNTNTTMSNNTNTNTAIRGTTTAKYHIVLRGRNNELVSWKGYEDGDTAFCAFTKLSDFLIKTTEGDFHWEEEGTKTYLADSDGNKVSLCRTTPELILEILFGNSRFVPDMFNDFLGGKVA